MMMLSVISVGNDRGVVLNGETVCTFDPACDDQGCLEMLEQVAVSLSSMLNISIQREFVEPFNDWCWSQVINKSASQKIAGKSDTTIELAFDITSASVNQKVIILDDQYDEEKLIAGLNSGTLATTTWHESGDTQYIDTVASGEHVAEILSQEIDGEYEDYH